MIERATLDDVPAVAEMLNHPIVRPTIGGDGVLDPTELIADPRNIVLFAEGGGAAFLWRGPGVYEGHSFFTARGREAISLGKAFLREMAGARMIWGATPEGNRPARWFNRQLGFQSQGMIEMPDTGRCELFMLEGIACR